MEFKGTKGRWNHFDESDLSIWGDYMDKVCEVTDKRILGETTIETKANALIISKAPEMLEMLILVYKNVQLDNISRGKLEQLIKQATEL